METENPIKNTALRAIVAFRAVFKWDFKSHLRKEQTMKIESLSERIANAENKISKKQLTIAKKQALIAKKQKLIEVKGLANSDSPEVLTLKWDIEHYTGDINRLEREIVETTPYL